MTYSIAVSENLYHQLERRALPLRRSVSEWVSETVKRGLSPSVKVEDDLPPWLHAELRAMQELSDTALWTLARSTMRQVNNDELAHLNEIGQERPLTTIEQAQQQALLNESDETVLRRAHAAILLQARGYDMSDPAVLRS